MNRKLLREALKGITFSETEVAKIYKVGKPKVRRMLGKEIRAEQLGRGNSKVRCDAYDVLIPLIEQCVYSSLPINSYKFNS